MVDGCQIAALCVGEVLGPWTDWLFVGGVAADGFGWIVSDGGTLYAKQ